MSDEPPVDVDRLTRLRTQRDLLLVHIALCESDRDFVALSREYRDCMAQIADIEPKKAEGDGIDEIAQRRNARRSGTAKGSRNSKRTG